MDPIVVDLHCGRAGFCVVCRGFGVVIWRNPVSGDARDIPVSRFFNARRGWISADLVMDCVFKQS